MKACNNFSSFSRFCCKYSYSSFLTALLRILFLVNLDLNSYYLVYDIIHYGVMINIVLGIFNLLPIPPLDGSKILFNFIPQEAILR